MKGTIIALISAFTAMALLPMLGMGETAVTQTAAARESSVCTDTAGSTDEAQTDGSTAPQSTAENTSVQTSESDSPSGDNSREDSHGFPEAAVFRILDTGTGEVITVSDREFCCGALAYEMPPGYEQEALKAQCIACYTHFCRLREQQRSGPDAELKGADFSADLSDDEFYISNEHMKKSWGKMYADSRSRIESAVDAAAGLVLTDENGELIDAAYHAISGGVTESAADIFGREDKHLLAVASPWDRSAPDYCTKKEFTEKEFVKLLKENNSKLNSKTVLAQDEFKAERTNSGAVLEMDIGGCKLSGAELRSIFSLRSCDFDLQHKNKKFIFTTRGYGHGVGMSQNGAQCMAQQGEDYREILLHYYTDVDITSYKNDL